MKFSHSIQFNAVPDWSSHYIAYSTLKKHIYGLEKTAHQTRAGAGDAESGSGPLLGNEDPEYVFARHLDVELEKISSFFAAKEGELLEEATQLLADVEERDLPRHGPATEAAADASHLEPPASSHGNRYTAATESDEDERNEDDSDDGTETTGLTAGLTRRLSRKHTDNDGEIAPSTRSQRRSTNDWAESSFLFPSSALYSTAILLKKRIINLYVQLCELESYIQLNRTGFGKVLKKFDKILDREMRPKYLASSVDAAYPFTPEALTGIRAMVAKLVDAYAEVVTHSDSGLAKKDLKSHLREHVVWERNTVWRDLIGMERRAEAASLGRSLLGNAQERTAEDGKSPVRSALLSGSGLNLSVALVLFLVVLSAPLMSRPEQQNCLAMVVFVSYLWATEAIPLFVTSLMIPFLAVVLRVVLNEAGDRLHAKEATAFVFSAMWTPVIMLLLGGFTLAAALSKCKIDKRLATLVLSKAGTRPRTVLLANMFVAALASMLISNVAAPVLCFGIIEPMLRTLPSGSNMSRAVIMGIALASNIGGMLSPIASPQNVIAMQNMSPEPSWGQWLFIVLPVGAISILAIWLLLLVTFNPGAGTAISPIRPVRERFSGTQWFVSAVTVATIVLWCFSGRLADTFGDMGVVAVIPIVLFFGSGVLTKEDFNNFPWTIIILAAGGLSLGKSVNSSGLLHTIAGVVTRDIRDLSLFGVLVTFSSLILVVATFISHTVAALIVLPLVASVGRDMADPKPNLLVMAGVLMCSAAMGLPTSGFPNMTAIMKEDQAGQRYLQVKHFISRGVPSSLLTLVVVITLGYGAMLAAHLD